MTLPTIQSYKLMYRFQIIAIVFAVSLLAGLFFAVRTRPLATAAVEQTRSLNADAVSPEELVQAGKTVLKPQAMAAIELLEKKAATAAADQKVATLKQLASAWNEAGNFAVGGTYSEQIAQLDASDSAWSIAGTTFMFALKTTKDENLRTFAAQHATSAFEKAVSLAPNTIAHRINLALSFVESPSGSPMKGIAMLTDLADKNPNNSAIFMTLGKLALRTGQTKRQPDDWSMCYK